MFIVLGLYSRTKLCFCLNLCRPPGTYSIRPIEKLLNCQQRDDVRWVLLQATKNSAVALGSRNNMISIHQWNAWTNEGKTALIQSYSRTVSWMVSSFSASLDWRFRHSHLASTLFHSLVPWENPAENPTPDNTPQSIGELRNGLLYQTGSKNGVI